MRAEAFSSLLLPPECPWEAGTACGEREQDTPKRASSKAKTRQGRGGQGTRAAARAEGKRHGEETSLYESNGRRSGTTPSGFPFHSAVLSVLANFNHQISDHNDVDQQYGDFCGAHSFGEFIDFQRNERRRGDNRKVFSPALAQPQTNALGEQGRRVKESARAEFFQLLSVKGRKFLQQPVNVAIVGIAPENIYPARRLGGHVLVQ